MTRHDDDGRNLTRSGLDSAPEREAAVTLEGSLDGIRRSETVADRVEFESVRRELPEGWDVRPDLVQFGPEPLAETVRFRESHTGSQIVLKPVDSDEPAGDIEFYERSGPQAARQRTMSVEPLSKALRVAVNRAHQLDR